MLRGNIVSPGRAGERLDGIGPDRLAAAADMFAAWEAFTASLGLEAACDPARQSAGLICGAAARLVAWRASASSGARPRAEAARQPRSSRELPRATVRTPGNETDLVPESDVRQGPARDQLVHSRPRQLEPSRHLGHRQQAVDAPECQQQASSKLSTKSGEFGRRAGPGGILVASSSERLRTLTTLYTLLIAVARAPAAS
jgi:hypothetical protein